MRRSTLTLIGSMLMLTVVAACTSPQAQFERETQSQQRQAAALEKAGTADALAAAAVLLAIDLDNAARAADLAARATAADPQSSELAWLHVRLCAMHEKCASQAQAVEDRFRKLAPDNGAAEMGALLRARELYDAAATDAAIQKLAGASRFEIYWTPLVARLAPPIAEVESTLVRGNGNAHKRLREAIIQVIGALGAVDIPPFMPLVGACRGMELERAGRREQCRRIGALMQKSDTVASQQIGFSIAKGTWPERSPKRAALELESQTLRTITESGSAALDKRLRRAAYAPEYLALLNAHRREEDLCRAALDQP